MSTVREHLDRARNALLRDRMGIAGMQIDAALRALEVPGRADAGRLVYIGDEQLQALEGRRGRDAQTSALRLLQDSWDTAPVDSAEAVLSQVSGWLTMHGGYGGEPMILVDGLLRVFGVEPAEAGSTTPSRSLEHTGKDSGQCSEPA